MNYTEIIRKLTYDIKTVILRMLYNNINMYVYTYSAFHLEVPFLPPEMADL